MVRGTPEAASGTVCRRFREIVAVSGERTAVCDQRERMTYARLDERSDRIASGLLQRGLEPQEPVALALPKSCDQIAALLGILKAGGAYVPIVNNQPAPRLHAMLDDAGARFAVTRDGYLDELWGDAIEALPVDRLAESEARDAYPTVEPGHLAYIMYTSGSTGTPKGVMIEHAGIIRLVCDQDYLPFGPDLNFLFAAPLSFDVSTLEIFTPLLHGAVCVIAPEGVPDADALAELTARESVRGCCLAFGLFRSLFEANPAIFEPIHTVAVGGERVEPSVIARAQRRLPGVTFVNAYGPTEATMLATTHTIDELVDPRQQHIPIGVPLRGVEALVLDEHRRPVGPGEPGELCLGGIGIARGYLNREELTRERFVTVNHAGRPLRVYRTGDRVVLDEHERLVFLGRIDAQVKLRGNRIELGEIEHCAARLGWVSGAVACVVGEGGSARLGMLVEGEREDRQALLTHLREHLPPVMVPEVVLFRDGLPINRNGKLDRKEAARIIEHERDASPTPSALRAELCTETERALAELMGEVLGVPVRHGDDRFLRLGGHSLRAVVLCSRIRERFGVRVPISMVYERQTVSELALGIDALRERDPGGVGGEDALIQPSPNDSPGPLSYNQQRLWMLDRMHPGDPSYIVTFRLEHDGALDRDAFARAWSSVCARHDTLCTRIAVVDEEPVQIVDRAIAPEPRFVDAAGMTDEEIARAIERESSRGFDLTTGPLVRCGVYDTGERASVHITMHHIISDAWSCAVMQRELRECYTAACEGREPDLPELRVQYRDYARWERRLQERPSYRQALREWVEHLRGAPMVRLPADQPAVGSGSSRGVRVTRSLDPARYERVCQAAQSLGVTTFAYTLGVFKLWLSRLTLEDDIVVGVPVANRQDRQTEGLIGFFMETLALRDRIDGSRTLGEQIRAIARNALHAFDRRDVPFQHIVEALGLHGQHDRNPLFEVFFNSIAIPLSSRDERRVLGFSSHEIDNRTAKFDLTCYFYEDPEDPRIIFNARGGRFARETVEWYLTQYCRLLEASCEHLDTPVARVPLDLTPITTKHPAEIPAPELPGSVRTDGSIIDQIERTVLEHPDRTAVRSDSDALSYADLWERSAALARRLAGSGVNRGERVMIVASDPIATCVATIAAMRSGASAVPTDHHWPEPRLRTIAALARPAAVLTDSDSPVEWTDAACVRISGKEEGEHAEESPLPALLPDDTAYIMFTSGSTGAPKGVVQTHAAVVGHMRTFAHAIGLRAGQRLLQLSSFAFDAAVMDMFACWFTGATLCVRDPRASSPDEVASWVSREKIDVVHAAPTLMRWLLGGLESGVTMPQVRTLVLGGESTSEQDVRAIVERFPGCVLLVNGLGLTESSLTLQYRVDPHRLDRPPHRLPVGYPVEGVRMRLLDRSGQPCGPTGEIEIESDRIARGYLVSAQDPEVPLGQPGGRPGTRRLRTGDLGTLRHDGSVMHLGRVDAQVQVRGCRVEPTEVEQALRALDGVRDAAVSARSEPDGGHTLVGVVVCDDALTPDSLGEALSRRLPSYMVPEHWRRVAQIPRVGGGKVDRSSLERLEEIPFADRTPAVSRGAVDERTESIMEAFAHVLGRERVGADDHFFHLGGNSLRVIQLFVRLKAMFEHELPISVLYRSPTPRKLRAEYERMEREQDARGGLIELRSDGDDRCIVVLPGIGGHPLGFGPLIDRLGTPGRVLGVQYPDAETLERIGRSLPSLAEWVIEGLRLKEGRVAPDLIGYSFGGSLAIEIAMRLQHEGHPPGRVVLLDAHLPYGLPRKGRVGRALVHLQHLFRGNEDSRIDYLLTRLRTRLGIDGRGAGGVAGKSSGKPPAQAMGGNDGVSGVLEPYKQVSRINRELVLRYRPRWRYDAPVLLIRARQPDWFRFHKDDAYNGFSAVIDPQRITRVGVDAGHLDLFKPGAVEDIARTIDAWLSRGQLGEHP